MYGTCSFDSELKVVMDVDRGAGSLEEGGGMGGGRATGGGDNCVQMAPRLGSSGQLRAGGCAPAPGPLLLLWCLLPLGQASHRCPSSVVRCAPCIKSNRLCAFDCCSASPPRVLSFECKNLPHLSDGCSALRQGSASIYCD